MKVETNCSKFSDAQGIADMNSLYSYI